MNDYIMYNASIMLLVKARGGSFEVLGDRRYSSPTTYSEMKCVASISMPSPVPKSAVPSVQNQAVAVIGFPGYL